MNLLNSRTILFIILFCRFLSSNASHIVGGVMNYKYLGNNNFEITLSVYRDDIRANTNAFLDDPAIIRIYDGFTEVEKEFSLRF